MGTTKVYHKVNGETKYTYTTYQEISLPDPDCFVTGGRCQRAINHERLSLLIAQDLRFKAEAEDLLKQVEEDRKLAEHVEDPESGLMVDLGSIPKNLPAKNCCLQVGTSLASSMKRKGGGNKKYNQARRLADRSLVYVYRQEVEEGDFPSEEFDFLTLTNQRRVVHGDETRDIAPCLISDLHAYLAYHKTMAKKHASCKEVKRRRKMLSL